MYYNLYLRVMRDIQSTSLQLYLEYSEEIINYLVINNFFNKKVFLFSYNIIELSDFHVLLWLASAAVSMI